MSEKNDNINMKYSKTINPLKIYAAPLPTEKLINICKNNFSKISRQFGLP